MEKEYVFNITINAGNANKEIKGITDQFSNMGKSLVKTLGPIGILVSAVTGLFAAFAKTEAGGRKLATAVSYLSGAFNKVVGDIGMLMVQLVEYIQSPTGALQDLSQLFQDVMTNPMKYIEQLGTAIYDNIISRLTGLVDTLGIAGKALSLLLQGKFDEAAKATDGLGDSMVQAATGIEDASGKLKTMVPVVTGYLTEVDKAAEATVAFDKAQKALAISLSRAQGELDKLNAKAELEAQIMDDATLSYTKRKKAAEDVFKSQEDAAKKQLEIANLSLSIAAGQLAQDKRNNASTLESAVAYQDALNARQVAELGYNKKVAELSTVRRQLLSDESESNLDQIIDGWDAAKMVTERQIADIGGTFEDYTNLSEKLRNSENLTAKERLAMIKNTTVTEEESIARRKKLTADLAVTTQNAYKNMENELKTWADRNGDAVTDQINLNELTKISDSKLMNEKIKSFNLSELQQNRLLEMVREKLAADQDIYDAQKQIAVEEVELTKKKIEEQIALEKQYTEQTLDLNKDLQSDISSLGVSGLEDYKQMLAEKYSLALENAIATGEDTTAISQQYADKLDEIDKVRTIQAVQATADMLGQSAALFEENTLAYKILASSQIVMDTILSAMGAYKATVGIPYVGPVLAPIAAGVATATGAKALAELNGIEFEDGGNTLAALGGMANGPSHAQGGIPGTVRGNPIEFEGGEYITNKKATKRNQMALETINKLGANNTFRVVPIMAEGGMVGFNQNSQIDMQLDISKNITEAFRYMPSPVVSVVDIQKSSDRVRVLDNNATF